MSVKAMGGTVTVVLRDTNGNHYEISGSRENVYCRLESGDADRCQVLFVTYDGTCIYSLLLDHATTPLDIEDLIGFLA